VAGGYRGPVTWLGGFLTVAGVLVALVVLGAAVLDGRARAQGHRLHPQPVRERVHRPPARRPPGRGRRPGDRRG
jgi:hypothetical protein